MRLSDFVFTKMYFCRQNVVLIWPLWIWTSLIKVLEKEIRITYCFRTQRLLMTNLIKMLNNLMFLGLICFVSSNPAQFEEFKRNFDRQYATESEELQRYEIFRTNLAKINDHNSRKGIMIFIWKRSLDFGFLFPSGETWRMAVNQFADITEEEFRWLDA